MDSWTSNMIAEVQLTEEGGFCVTELLCSSWQDGRNLRRGSHQDKFNKYTMFVEKDHFRSTCQKARNTYKNIQRTERCSAHKTSGHQPAGEVSSIMPLPTMRHLQRDNWVFLAWYQNLHTERLRFTCFAWWDLFSWFCQIRTGQALTQEKMFYVVNRNRNINSILQVFKS